MASPRYGAAYDELLRVIPQLDSIQATADLATTNPAGANQAILEGYVALSNALGRLLHGDVLVPENATFATFAAWAALSLRHEAVLDDNRGDFTHPARRMYRWVAKEVLDGDEAIARNIVRGQAEIYEEIGSAIYSLLQQALTNFADQGFSTMAGSPATDAGVWMTIWEQYRQGLTELRATLNRQRAESEALDVGSVIMLLGAVQPYFQVLQSGLSQTGPAPECRKRRAELILLGNLRILAYEQKRLQPVFERNLSYVPDAIKSRLANRFGRHVALINALRAPLQRAHNLTSAVGEAFQIAATRRVFSMTVGSEDLSFGHNVPVPPPANPLVREHQPAVDRQRYHRGAFFPVALNDLRERETWAEWQLHDRSSGQGGRTAVNNWLRYSERMNFIANVFRSRQQMTAVYGLPGSPPPPPPEPTPLGRPLDLSSATRQRLQSELGDGP